MKKWAVIHVDHVRVPHKYSARLFITKVPDTVNAGELAWLLECAGYKFGEFGIKWANHCILPAELWPAEVIGTWRRRGADVVTYDELLKLSSIDDE